MVLARVIHRFRLDCPRGEMMKQMYPTLLFLDRPVRVEIVERKYKYICICTVLNLIYILNSFCRSMPIVCLSLAMCFNEYNKQYLFVHAKLASYLTSSVH